MGIFSKGVLGINARNLHYIKPFNKRKDILFADDKLKTKHFLSARGVNVPKLFGVIRNKEELDRFDFASLPNNFVVKPNLGSGGQGIIPISGRDGHDFLTSSGKVMSNELMREHIIDIIDGRFSVNNNADCAFFEQLLITHEGLAPYTYKGLPDIRVVVFNLIPVMAMLRLPTKASEGKANLQQGAVGVGLDLAKGETTFITQNYKIISELPEIGPIKIKIPFWDEILHMAVKTQLISNLGYLAADIAIDQTSGPVLLELNARAGLKVQIANLAGLDKRLKRIKGIKVTTPEKGVRIAKDMFGNVTERTISNLSGKKIIGNEEIVEIISEKENFRSLAKININSEKSSINQSVAEKIINYSPDKKVKLILAGQRITTLLELNTEQTEPIIIGKRDLSNFLIDPSKKKNKNSSLPKASLKPVSNFFFSSKPNYHEIDQQLYDLDRKVKLVTHLTPKNISEELAIFSKNKEHNPQFYYEPPNIDFIKVNQTLDSINCDDSALGQLFQNKKLELKNRYNLVASIGSDQFTQVSKLNFQPPTPELTERALHLFKENTENTEIFPQTVNALQAKLLFEEVLQKNGLDDWSVHIRENMNSSCSVSKGKTVYIKKSARFSENRIKQLIAHEIETHVFTNENGRLQPYKIFQIGTANYLKTQEGLAVFNQEKHTNVKHHIWGATTFLATHFAEQYSFAETYHHLIKIGSPPGRALSATIKAKRGLEQTSQPGAFTKGYIYFIGATQIEDFVLAGSSLKDLYIGKIDLESIDLINTIDNLVPPKYIPSWYK